MHEIGIINLSEKKSIEISKVIKQYNYIVMDIMNRNQIKNLEELIIFYDETSNFQEVCQWLVDLQEKTNLVTWIIYSKRNHNEKRILLQLGANYIMDNDMQALILVIRNYFNLKNYRSKMIDIEKKNQNIKLDESKFSVTLNNEKEVFLTKKEFKLFLVLFNNSGRGVSYEELNENVWEKTYIEKDKYKIANTVHHLREKLGKNNSNIISTIRSKGYLLNISK